MRRSRIGSCAARERPTRPRSPEGGAIHSLLRKLAGRGPAPGRRAPAGDEGEAPRAARERRTLLFAPSISGASAERAIIRALAPLAGVERARVDLSSRVVTVVHHESVEPAALAAAVEAEGYPVRARREPGR